MSVERVFLAGRSVRIRASATAWTAACPVCGTVSGRVHSRYEGRLCDRAVPGQEVLIELAAGAGSAGVDRGAVRRAPGQADDLGVAADGAGPRAPQISVERSG